MTETTRLVQVGTGGFGAWWCREFLPAFADDPRLEVVAAVDASAEALENAVEGLGLAADRCFTDLDEALNAYEADALTIVVPPAHHESIVDAAIERRLDILSEKPISDTLESSIRIVEKVRDAGLRMGVTMGHRFDEDKTAFRTELRNPRNGRLDYLVFRFTASARDYGTWGGSFRHEMAHPMLIEGSVHHLDILVDMVGSPCRTIWAETWRPPWAEYAGDTNVLIVMEFENGARAQYEAATATAVALNPWRKEYLRAECEFATLVMDRRRVVRYGIDPDAGMNDAVDLESGEVIAPPPSDHWTHRRLIDDFLSWRGGGPPMETEVTRNLMSVVLVEAAIASSRRREVVEVAEFIPNHLPID